MRSAWEKGINFLTPSSLYQAKNSITNKALKNWLIQWSFLLYLRWREVQKEVFLLWTIINYQRKRFIMTFTRTIIVRSSSFELMRNENMSPVACGCCRPVCRINFPPSLSPNLCWTQPMEPSIFIFKHFLFNLNQHFPEWTKSFIFSRLVVGGWKSNYSIWWLD